TNTFSRIWGKGNYYPEKPFNFKSKDIYGAILPLVLRLVNEYETVREHKSLAKQASDRKSNLKKAFDSDFIPRKLTKSEFESKKIELKQLDSEIERIKSIVKHNINNLESLISSKTLSYKKRKDILNKGLMVEKSH
ncbi:flagellar protein FlgN, partial [Vibrio cholerae]